MSFTVTLKELRSAGACYNGYNKLVFGLQGKKFSEIDNARESYIRYKHDEPISIAFIAENNGLDDALWALRCVKNHDRDIRLLAVQYARQVQHLMEDERSINTINVAEKFANGEATEQELAAARVAAGDAAWVAAGDAAWVAAGVAARVAAWVAARAAAWVAAGVAARVAAGVAARVAAGVAAGAAAGDAARAAQKEMLIKMCNGTAPWQV